MRGWKHGLAAVLLSLAAQGTAGGVAATPYTFTTEGHSYTVQVQFVVAAPPEKVLAALYPFERLREISGSVSTAKLIDEGPGWQTVDYVYSTWLWSLTTTFRRELDVENGRIRFWMLHARRTGLPIPLPTASSGKYQADAVASGTLLTFTQTAQIGDSLLLGPFLARARSESARFAQSLEAYTRATLE